MNHLVKDYISEMQKCLITHMESSGTKVQFPKDWELQSCTTKLFNIRSHSVQYARVSETFLTTIVNVNIVSVQ